MKKVQDLFVSRYHGELAICLDVPTIGQPPTSSFEDQQQQLVSRSSLHHGQPSLANAETPQSVMRPTGPVEPVAAESETRPTDDSGIQDQESVSQLSQSNAVIIDYLQPLSTHEVVTPTIASTQELIAMAI